MKRIAFCLFALIALALLREPILEGRSFAIHSLYRSEPWRSMRPAGVEVHDNGSGSDGTLTFYPRRRFTHEMLGRGRLPLWNPYLLGGLPFAADPHSALFYPFNLLYAFFSPERLLPLLALLQLTLAGFFACLFFRDLGLADSAAFLGGIVFAMNPFFMTHLVNPTNVDSGIWLPAMLLSFRRAYLATMPSQRGYWLAWLAAAQAMSILGGFPQIMVFSTYALLFYAISLVRWRGGKEVGWRRFAPLGIALGGIFGGALLAGVLLLPLGELAAQSARRTIDYTFFSKVFVPVETFFMYLVPDFFGTPTRNFFGAFADATRGGVGGYIVWRNSFLENCGYTGVLPLFLLPFAFRGRGGQGRGYFLFLLLFALGATLGTPLFRFCYHVMPGFKFSRICRIVFLYGFGMAGLSAIGWDRAMRGKDRGMRIVLLLTAFSVGGLLLFATARYGHPEVLSAWRARLDGISPGGAGSWGTRIAAYRLYLDRASGQLEAITAGIRRFALLGMAGASLLLLLCVPRLPRRLLTVCLLLLLVGDLLWTWGRYLTFQPEFYPERKPASLAWLQAHAGIDRIARFGAFREILPPNTPQVYHLHDMAGSNALLIDRYGQLAALIEPEIYVGKKKIISMSHLRALSSPILDLLGVRYILSRRYLPLSLAPLAGEVARRPLHLRLVRDGPMKIYENLDRLPRVFVAPHAEVIPTSGAMRNRLADPGFDPGKTVLFEEPPPGLSEQEGFGDDSTARIIRYEPTEVEIEAGVQGGGYLVLSDTWYPGWRAYVDRRPTRIYRVDHALRGIFLPDGRHTVRFVYRPLRFHLGAAVSIVALALWSLLLWRCGFRATRGCGTK